MPHRIKKKKKVFKKTKNPFLTIKKFNKKGLTKELMAEL